MSADEREGRSFMECTAEHGPAALVLVPFAEPRGLTLRDCSKCGESKPLGEFGANRGGRLGRRTYCRGCDRAAQAARLSDPAKRAAGVASMRSLRAEYARRPLDIGDGMLPKRCLPPTSGGCGQQLIRGDFNRLRRAADQRDPLCRDCKARKDAERALMRKLRLADHWEEQGIFNCHICANDFSEDDEIHIDHVWPRARGGTDDVSNMYPAHALCNMSKSDADPWEFLPRTLADAGINFWAAYRRKPQGAL